MLKKLCKISAILFTLQEIISNTILVLFFGFTKCFILLVLYPVIYIAKGLNAISNFADDRGKYYSEFLQEIYSTLSGGENNVNIQP